MTRVLMIGDIVGKPGRRAINMILPRLISDRKIDFVIANGENISAGKGLQVKQAKEMLAAGIDVLTGGNHTWQFKDSHSYLDAVNTVIRPLNVSSKMPGKGWTVVSNRAGIKFGVINLIGRVYMPPMYGDPFLDILKTVETMKKETNLIFVDFHAEATSEKVAMGHYLDGKVTAIIGTHTHIPTADTDVLSQGTAYQTDLGMTGPYDSVIGNTKETILHRFTTGMPVKFTVAKNNVKLCGILVEADPETGKATSAERIQIPMEKMDYE